MNGCRARSTSKWAHRNLFYQPSRVGNLHCSGISWAMTASPDWPKGTFEGGWCHGRQRKCWMDMSKSGHYCSQWLPPPPPPHTHTQKTGRRSQLNCPCPPEITNLSSDWTCLFWAYWLVQCCRFPAINKLIQKRFGVWSDASIIQGSKCTTQDCIT